MNAFIYQGALYCEACTQEWFARNEGTSLPVNDNGCSDTFPQGPLANGGGEADSPSHCDSCGVHLENPLTADGLEKAANRLGGWIESGEGDPCDVFFCLPATGEEEAGDEEEDASDGEWSDDLTDDRDMLAPADPRNEEG